MPNYVVKPGDCLASIADRFGLSSWKRIYDHPSNAAFRQQRTDPNLIFAGDVVFVPDRERRDDRGDTDKKHRFQREATKTQLRIAIEDPQGEPLRGTAFELVVGELRFSGKTDASGRIAIDIPASATTGELTIDPGEVESVRRTWKLRIGALDPVEKTSGVQARLNNLAIDSGPVDNIQGPLTTAAVKQFQEKHGLGVDGIVGPITRKKLKEVYGC